MERRTHPGGQVKWPYLKEEEGAVAVLSCNTELVNVLRTTDTWRAGDTVAEDAVAKYDFPLDTMTLPSDIGRKA